MRTSIPCKLRRCRLLQPVFGLARNVNNGLIRRWCSLARPAGLFLLAAICVACVSSGPATQYFSLFAIKQAATQGSELADKSLSFGIGPITLPEYMDNPNIVSLSDRQQVRVSGQYAWAGDLKRAMGRVIADNLSQYWLLDKVSAFPWDNRVRPDYQVHLVFDEFGGQRGGEVRLRVFWRLLNQRGDRVYLAKRAAMSAVTADTTAEAYVAALNDLLNQLSNAVALNVNEFLRLHNSEAD